MLITRRHTAVADSHASRPCPPSLAHSVGGCPRRDHRAISASSCGSGVGSGSSTRIGQLPVLSLEVLLGLRAGGAVVRVHTRECIVNDRKRYEQKIMSFGTLDHQCSRWHPIASVIDRSRTPPTTTGLPPSRRCFAPQAAAWLTASASRLAPKAPARSGCTRRARR